MWLHAEYLDSYLCARLVNGCVDIDGTEYQFRMRLAIKRRCCAEGLRISVWWWWGVESHMLSLREETIPKAELMEAVNQSGSLGCGTDRRLE